jgi:hypothetical protein
MDDFYLIDIEEGEIDEDELGRESLVVENPATDKTDLKSIHRSTSRFEDVETLNTHHIKSPVSYAKTSRYSSYRYLSV